MKGLIGRRVEITISGRNKLCEPIFRGIVREVCGTMIKLFPCSKYLSAGGTGPENMGHMWFNTESSELISIRELN
ncbi:MAG: hypothetical protein PHI53_01070 [Candidatus Pacebacteria bacterium]|nr:hypothetical protein [Candidatus Paceibacterota bacterium]